LKPDVCRRVVGRLPSPSLEKDGMATARSEDRAVYLVRSLGFEPETSISRLARSTKLSKTDPHFRRGGALSGPEQRHTSATLPVLETCITYWFCWALSTWTTHRFCTEYSHAGASSF